MLYIGNTNNRPIHENSEKFSDNINNLANEEYNDDINENIDDQISVNKDESNAEISVVENLVPNEKYNDYNRHTRAHMDFINNLKKIIFSHSCAICDRLWWKNNLKNPIRDMNLF